MKKNLLLITMLALFAFSCSNQAQTSKKEAEKTTTVASNTEDASITKVYYFHGKQRCRTCIAVQNLVEKTIAETYADNDKVQFVEINTSNKEFADLVEKYEVSWNALIIAKGDKSIDLTEQAFALAQTAPEELIDLIKQEVNNKQTNK